MSFQLPKDAPIYVEDIIDRCGQLINAGVWTGLHMSRLRRWLANFTTDEDKYFAACVLDSLIFRSEDQTIALVRQLFQRTIPDLMRFDPPSECQVVDWLGQLKANFPDPKVRLVTVDDPGPEGPPTKSAYIVARLMKRRLMISERWITKVSSIGYWMEKGIKTFVFIDDFLGTGSQFEDVFGSTPLSDQSSGYYVAYTPLAAHANGISRIRRAFPWLRVKSVEELDASHGAFHAESKCFDDGVNTPESARAFYYGMLKRHGINVVPDEREGFGGLDLLYAFSHAAPDNSLPLLWWPEIDNWMPLVDR